MPFSLAANVCSLSRSDIRDAIAKREWGDLQAAIAALGDKFADAGVVPALKCLIADGVTETHGSVTTRWGFVKVNRTG